MKEVFLDEEELANFLFKGLIELGYTPTEDELDDITELIFEYLDELESDE